MDRDGKKKQVLTDELIEAWDWYAWFLAVSPNQVAEIEDREEGINAYG